MNAKRCCLLCVALGILLGGVRPGPARAEGRLHKREVEMPGGEWAELLKRTRPSRPATPGGPVLTVEDFVDRQQARMQEINDRQRKQLERLIHLAGADDPQTPDYLFRLAELYAERHRFFNARARSKDEPIFRADQARDAGAAARLRREQQDDQRLAGQALHGAIENYVAATQYALYARMDEVLFRLGTLLQIANREDKAREFFHRLVKDYPQSRYVPNAYLSFADYFFAKGEMSSALAFYEKVAEFPRSHVFGFALYKKGWAQINLGAFKAALGTFVNLIERCQAGQIDRTQRVPLEKEARRDLVKAYVRTPGASPDKAWEFFQRVGGREAPTMLEVLAELYWEQGMAADSSRAYRRLMALTPQAQSLCAWQGKVLRNTLSAGSEPEQVQELVRLGSGYRYLRSLSGVRTDVLDECRNQYHDTAREMAFVLHKQAQRLKRLATYQLAARVYREFLDAFESEKSSVEVAFYLAECLWQIASLSPASDTARWSEAAEEYTRVIHLDPASRFVKEAAYAAVLAWQNALYLDDDDLKRRPAETL